MSLKSINTQLVKGSISAVFDTSKDEHVFQPSYIPKFTTVEKFIEDKIEILQEQLYITLTEEDLARLNKCKTETQVNNVVRWIISEHWR